MGVTVADNFLGVCEQKGPLNMRPIVDGGGAVIFFLILLNALLKTPKLTRRSRSLLSTTEWSVI